MYKVYIASSMQENNKGVVNYGNEEDNMFTLADEVKLLLEKNGNFKVFRNRREWNLSQMVNDCNIRRPHLFIDNHSNGGTPKSEGCEVFYYGDGGVKSNSYKISKLLYNKISKVAPDKDRGIKRDDSLYNSGLFVIRNTLCPSSLVEHFFHTNSESVKFFKENIDKYAYAEYTAICEYFNIEYDFDNNDNYYKQKFKEIYEFCKETLECGGN